MQSLTVRLCSFLLIERAARDHSFTRLVMDQARMISHPVWVGRNEHLHPDG
jgi:hypothetical protein